MKTCIPVSPPSKPHNLVKMKKREFLPPLSHEKLDMQSQVGNEEVAN